MNGPYGVNIYTMEAQIKSYLMVSMAGWLIKAMTGANADAEKEGVRSKTEIRDAFIANVKEIPAEIKRYWVYTLVTYKAKSDAYVTTTIDRIKASGKDPDCLVQIMMHLCLNWFSAFEERIAGSLNSKTTRKEIVDEVYHFLNKYYYLIEENVKAGSHPCTPGHIQ